MDEFVNIIEQPLIKRGAPPKRRPKIDNRGIFCTGCRGLLGGFSGNGDIYLRAFRLVRVDPMYQISICHGRTEDDFGIDIQHQHFAQIAMVENLLSAPIQPLRIRSVRNGRLMETECPFAREISTNPPNTLPAQAFFMANRPIVPGPKCTVLIQLSNINTKNVFNTHG